MKRENEIESEAWEQAIDYTDEQCFVSGFKQGIKWADQNPDWHNYKTDRHFPKDVILHTTEGVFSAEYMNYENQFYSGNEWILESTIIAWMPLPKPSKFN